MIFDELYYDEITRASFQEMIELSGWLNKIYGYHPVIIGGWAVYLHHKTLGSRDIDILFPTRELKQKVIEKYLLSHNYQLKSEGPLGLEKSYYKEVKTSVRREEIIIDACSIEEVYPVKGTEIIIPWQLSLDYQKEINIEGTQLYIPSVEVMLLYKAKAAIDREFESKKQFDPFYLQQKIVKDCHDIVTLISHCEIDYVLLNKLLIECGFYEHFQSAIEKIGMKKEIADKYIDWGSTMENFSHNLTSQRENKDRDHPY